MIKIKYDGAYPNLCSGHLEVWINDIYYDFGKYCLISGGCIMRDEDWDMWAEKGPWEIDKDSYPKDFPEEYKEKLLEVINEELQWGCCGGCI